MRSSWPLVLAMLLALTSCGEDSSTATWVVDPDEQVTSETTGFTAVVTRVGCGSGVDGEPNAPAIEYTESEVRITFRISPHVDSGTCEGTRGVRYEVELNKPLGDRSLVDGECQPGSTAWATAFCQEKGIRYAPE
jgi:hypothetical protein